MLVTTTNRQMNHGQFVPWAPIDLFTGQRDEAFRIRHIEDIKHWGYETYTPILCELKTVLGLLETMFTDSLNTKPILRWHFEKRARETTYSIPQTITSVYVSNKKKKKNPKDESMRKIIFWANGGQTTLNQYMGELHRYNLSVPTEASQHLRKIPLSCVSFLRY